PRSLHDALPISCCVEEWRRCRGSGRAEFHLGQSQFPARSLVEVELDLPRGRCIGSAPSLPHFHCTNRQILLSESVAPLPGASDTREMTGVDSACCGS